MRAMFVAALVAVSLAACSSSTPTQPPTSGGALLSSVPTTPTVCDGPTENNTRTCVGWGEPGQLVVVVLGSSSCPSVAKSATVTGTQAVTVVVEPTGGPSCTADAVETASEIAIPSSVNSSKLTSVTVGGISITLSPRSG